MGTELGHTNTSDLGPAHLDDAVGKLVAGMDWSCSKPQHMSTSRCLAPVDGSINAMLIDRKDNLKALHSGTCTGLR